jgi:hypothetical protein
VAGLLAQASAEAQDVVSENRHHPAQPAQASHPAYLDERMMRLEKSVVSVLNILKKIVATPAGQATSLNHPNE